MTKEERSRSSLSPSILKPGKNCRQCENADRAAFLIDAADDFPLQLGEFLNALANRRKRLEIHILLWDFSVLFGLEREWFLPIKLDWSTHRRIHLEMDGKHPWQ
ncbi:MAG: hypothetical protein KQH63_17660 [Desulfobulbaceae bacterium]|nr:hypothetical protein [Desulfobulbaceae bacterium]